MKKETELNAPLGCTTCILPFTIAGEIKACSSTGYIQYIISILVIYYVQSLDDKSPKFYLLNFQLKILFS